jgi:hypothetical protein
MLARATKSLLVGLLVWVAAGCDASVVTSDPPVMPSQPAPPALVSTPSPDELADAIRFRTETGLRADEDWIRFVYRNPAWVAAGERAHATPLTPVELADLEGRVANSAEVKSIVKRYARDHPDEWAGLYTDQLAQGLVVAQFTGHIDEHTAALRAQLSPEARLDVRQVRWSYLELKRLETGVKRDLDWLATVEIAFKGLGVYVDADRIVMQVSAPDPSVAEEIIEHYGTGERMRVEVQCCGPWKGGRGDLVVHAVHADGRPATHLYCNAIPDDPEAWHSGDVAHGTDDFGTCRLRNVGATHYVIELGRPTGNGIETVATVEVDVPAGGTGTVQVVVP